MFERKIRNGKKYEISIFEITHILDFISGKLAGKIQNPTNFPENIIIFRIKMKKEKKSKAYSSHFP
jgi:hypothetical protein